MRWLVVTPTFAVGLGVVIAAALGAPAPVELTTPPLPYVSGTCKIADCGTGNAKGTLATRGGSHRLVNPARHKAAGRAGGSGQGAGSGFVVEYRTMGQDQQGDFVGQLILASRNGAALPSWTLRFSYPSGQIRVVWGGSQLPPGTHTATVSSAQYRGNWSGGHVAQVVFSVSGPAGRPASCTVNGQACQYVTSLPGQGNPGGHGWGGWGGYNGPAGHGG